MIVVVFVSGGVLMLHLPLRTVKFVQNEFEKKLIGYKVDTFHINEMEKVLLIENSLALYVGKYISDMPVCLNAKDIYEWTKNNSYMDMPVIGGTYFCLHIEELTYNTIGFKYNHSKLMGELEVETGIHSLSLDIIYSKFKGYTRLYWCPEVETLAERIDKEMPALKLKERYKIWPGIVYYFIVLELEDIEGNIEYGVIYTNQKPHSHIVSKAHKWIKYGFEIGDMRTDRMKIVDAFKSWKGSKRQWILENKLGYFYFEKEFREKEDVWKHADEILEMAYQNSFTEEERNNYKRPINKWKSEEIVYNLIKKLYKDYKVIYQHRPFYLRNPNGGQMSYDVYISGIDVAIEYQGKQHFEPVEFFGGEDSYAKTIERDQLKRELSKQNNVKLVYINHWDVITPQLVRSRIEDSINSC